MKFRWFVVIRVWENFAVIACKRELSPIAPSINASRPIRTYSGKGVAQKGLAGAQHAIIYTGRLEPKPTPYEQGSGMRPSIRLRPLRKGEALHNMSRVNSDKLYTVEHNVKVREFGQVDAEHILRLLSSREAVLSSHR
jgi:hypothetical protein